MGLSEEQAEKVAPRAGAWIEIEQGYQWYHFLPRRPSRRGVD